MISKIFRTSTYFLCEEEGNKRLSMEIFYSKVFLKMEILFLLPKICELVFVISSPYSKEGVGLT